MSFALQRLQTKIFGDESDIPKDLVAQLETVIGLTVSQCSTPLDLCALIQHDSTIKNRLTTFIEGEISSSCSNGSLTSDLKIMFQLQWHQTYRSQFKVALNKVIKQEIASMCDGEYDEPLLPKLKEWYESNILPIIGIPNDAELLSSSSKYLTDCFCETRSNELFEMVSDFPDSLTAIQEVKAAADTVSIGLIGKKFRAVLQKRLLHLGASTSQILDFYVSMIKALRVIDPSDVLLNYVAVPIRSYLKGRKDAVRCIVASLTEGKESELHGELRQGGSLEYGVDEDDEELGPGVNWEPRKTNKDLNNYSASAAGGAVGAVSGGVNSIEAAKGLDVLSLLVSIYGSTGLFMNEYKVMLGDKLLSNGKYSYEQEIATLELLKIRFGETPLHPCEVMLKDMADSKRNNTAVHSEHRRLHKSSGGSIDHILFTAISENYWPHVAKEGMQYHDSVERLIGAYCESYTNLKKPRKLLPLQQMGYADLTLHFEDGSSRDFVTTPLQANVILHIADGANDGTGSSSSSSSGGSSTAVSLSRLLSLCGDVEEGDVLGALHYWMHKGVIREVHIEAAATATGEGSRWFEVVESQAALAVLDSSTMEEDGQMDMNLRMNAAADAQRQALLVKVDSYVRGFLKGHKSMDLDNLQSLLKNSFLAEERFDMTVLELKQFLQKLIDQGVVEVLGTSYSLVK